MCYMFYRTILAIVIFLATTSASQYSHLPTCNGAFKPNGRKEILEVHNFVRSEIANGRYYATDYKLPPAADMYKLLWSCELEESAQKWADRCTFEYSNNTEYGENIYVNIASDEVEFKGEELIGARSSFSWDRELRVHGMPTVQYGEDLTRRGITRATQMIWSQSRFIGCGGTMCRNIFYVVCRYNKRGNIPDEFVYNVGKTCSKCPSGSKCEEVTGLCL